MIGCDLCEEWFHGDCIGVTEKDSKLIKQYYCQKCKDDDSSLRTVFRSAPKVVDPHAVHAVEKKYKEKTQKKKYKEKTSKSSKVSCQCSGCRAPNCGFCSYCANPRGYSEKKQRCEQRVCVLKVKKKEQREKRRKRSVTPEIIKNPALEGLRQCHGSTCQMTARPQSKYCSDACGINLATNRIYQATFIPFVFCIDLNNILTF